MPFISPAYITQNFKFWSSHLSLENTELEAELDKLLQDDNDDDYLTEKLDGLHVHDSDLSSDEVKMSNQKKEKLTT